MAFKKGDKKPAGSGRKKGSKNLKTVLRAESVMAEADFNPIELLIELANSKDTPVDQKIKIAIELSSLINAKPKAKEVEPNQATEPAEDFHLDEASLLKLVNPE